MAELTYASYLHLDELLKLQHTRSSPAEHDELLFIVIHQSTELWLKELLHELDKVKTDFSAGLVSAATATLTRARRIFRVLITAARRPRDDDAAVVFAVPAPTRTRIGLPVDAIPRVGVRARHQATGRARPLPRRLGRHRRGASPPRRANGCRPSVSVARTQRHRRSARALHPRHHPIDRNRTGLSRTASCCCT